MKKFLCLIIAVIAAFSFSGCIHVDYAPSPNEKATVYKVSIAEINKHGTLVLATDFAEMANMNMTVGDIITVYVGEDKYSLPVGTAYSDVDTGSMLCRFDVEDGKVMLAVNMGSFVEAAGIGEKITVDQAPGYKWNVSIVEVGLELKEKGGYIEEYSARNLIRTNAREDYPALSDEQFANFRAVSVTGIKQNVLFRSSSPLSDALERNRYAMAEVENAGIKTVINLADDYKTMTSYPTYFGSYYAECNIITPEMSYDFTSEGFGVKVKECISFIAKNQGPYLIHCKEGKDRTGILCALIECYVGASAAEVEADYMLTYEYFYNVTHKDAAYYIIYYSNLYKTLCTLYKVEDIDSVNLREKAEGYFLSIGITEDTLSALDAKLK